MLCPTDIQVFSRNVFLVIFAPALVMFTIQIFNMAALLILTCQFVALLRHPSSCAGIAAAAGELMKDLRHRDVAEEAGCDFDHFYSPSVGNMWHLLVSIYSLSVLFNC